jgi:hypothetical protein
MTEPDTTPGNSSMTLEIGYHVMSTDTAADYGTYAEELSVVEFLRRVDQRKEIPLDITVTGLDRLLAAGDPEETAEYVHTVLRDRVNFVLNRSPVVQFVVDDVEYWDGPGPVIPVNGSNVRLVTIFGGSFEQEGPGWYSGEFNVQS